MVRAPCCEKTGLKKGSWSPEEDQILTNHIRLHGYPNWRALPKQAGLLRCGKSCRLRWTNYLRPDIKRGKFTQQEEWMIMDLHEKLGNRWSAIAAKMPGRTDNEIKNVWNTHLKKRVKNTNYAIRETNGRVAVLEYPGVGESAATSSQISSINVSPLTIDELFNVEHLSEDDLFSEVLSAPYGSWDSDIYSSRYNETNVDEDDGEFWYKLLYGADDPSVQFC